MIVWLLLIEQEEEEEETLGHEALLKVIQGELIKIFEFVNTINLFSFDIIFV